MIISSKSRTQFGFGTQAEVLAVLEEMRAPGNAHFTLSFSDGRELAFEPGEWNRLLDLAAKGAKTL
jgi:hypothetical protein